MRKTFCSSFQKIWSRFSDNNEKKEISNVDHHNAEAVEGLTEAREMKVAEIMIPRADVVAISASSSLKEIKDKFIETGFLRLIVYGKDLDDVIGFIHLKDLFAYVSSNEAEFSAHKMTRKTIYAARSTRCFTLLSKMKQECVEIAVILDEYGGIEGVISIERLTEQILTTIQNNDSEEVQSGLAIQQIHDNVYILDARTSIQKVEELFQNVEFLSEEEGEYETIGGFILSYLDRVPAKGERFTHIGGLEVEIIESTNRTIKVVKITKVKSSL